MTKYMLNIVALEEVRDVYQNRLSPKLKISLLIYCDDELVVIRLLSLKINGQVITMSVSCSSKGLT